MMNIKSPVVSGWTDGCITYEQANEVHRLHHEDCLTATQIARVTGISLGLVSGVLVGRYFPMAARRWERMNRA